MCQEAGGRNITGVCLINVQVTECVLVAFFFVVWSDWHKGRSMGIMMKVKVRLDLVACGGQDDLSASQGGLSYTLFQDRLVF